MSTFFKLSQGRSNTPFGALSLNTSQASSFGGSMNKTGSTVFSSKPQKHNKQTTDLKAFKEKYQINMAKPPLSCLKLIQIQTPKLFVSLNDLNQIEFPVMSYNINQLITFSKMIIDASPERKAIGKAFNLNRLIQLISEGYNVVAYHNFTHAFSLLLLLFQAYNRCNTLQKMLTQKQWFYVFIAALAHDLKHPGTNNAFEIKKQSQLANQAKNVAVLEKMHLNEFWNILKKNSGVNFLQGYASYESSHIKHIITRMVFSTDVSTHFKDLQSLKAITATYSQPLKGHNALFAVQQLFHACDIGNPCLDFPNYLNWSSLVSYEFNQITQQEKQLGLPVTTFLKYENINKFYNGQIGFIKGLVYPLWKELEFSMPGIKIMVQNIEKNMEELKRRSQDQQHCLEVDHGCMGPK